jgi:hypothetical protein
MKYFNVAKLRSDLMAPKNMQLFNCIIDASKKLPYSSPILNNSPTIYRSSPKTFS